MQNKTNKSISIIISTFVAVVMAITTFSLFGSDKKASALNMVENINMYSGLTTSLKGNFTNGQDDVFITEDQAYIFDYQLGDKKFLNNDSTIDGTTDLSLQSQNIESGSDIVLSNFQNKLSADNTTGYQDTVQNFYLAFNEAKTNKSEYLINDLSVQGYIDNSYVASLDGYDNVNSHGMQLVFENADSQQSNGVDTDSLQYGTKSFTNRYWYSYFDGTSAVVTNNQDQHQIISQATGKYTIVFEYSITHFKNVDDEYSAIVSDKAQLTYEFYLQDNSNYVEYPFFATTNTNHSEIDSVVASNDNLYKEYNYLNQTQELPTYFYKASTYNVQYDHTLNTETYHYTTTFTRHKTDGVNSYEYGLFEKFKGIELVDSYVMSIDNTNNTLYYYHSVDYLPANNTALADSTWFAKLEITATGEFEFVSNDYSIFAEYTVNEGEDNEDTKGYQIFQSALNTKIDYFPFITFEDLGVYQITNSYVISLGFENYKIIDSQSSTDIFKNSYKEDTGTNKFTIADFTYNTQKQAFVKKNVGDNFITVDKDNNKYDKSKDGGYTLNNIGNQSVFYNNSVKQPFNDTPNNTYSNHSNIYNNLFGSGTLEDNLITNNTTTPLKIPKTNLQPIYFDTYGTLSKESKYYQFSLDDISYYNSSSTLTINSDGTTLKNNAIKYEKDYNRNQNFSTDGLYIVKLITSVNTQNTTDQQKINQVFIFIIDNSTPSLTIQGGYYDSEGEAQTMTSLNSTDKYTNFDFIKIDWTTQTYFEGKIYVEYDFYQVSTLISSKNTYTKDAYLNAVSVNDLDYTKEGEYIITMYYGTNSIASKTLSVYVDRTAIDGQFEKVTVDGTNTSQIVSGQNSIIESNIVNSETFFTYTYSTATHGANVKKVVYYEIPFITDYNFVASRLSTTTTADEYKMITTNKSIDYTNSPSATTPKSYNYTSGQDNVQCLNLTSLGGIYIFVIEDQAGNVSYDFMIYDPSIAYPLYQIGLKDAPEINALSTTGYVNDSTKISFGTHKAINVNDLFNATLTVSDDKTSFASCLTMFRQDFKNNASKYNSVSLNDDETYLITPIDNVKVTITKKDQSEYIINKLSNSTLGYFNIYKSQSDYTSGDIQFENHFYFEKTTSYTMKQALSGEQTYMFDITDRLGNSSMSNRIQMNLDKAEFAAYFSKDKSSGTSTDYTFIYESQSYNLDNLHFTFNQTISDDDDSDSSYRTDVKYFYFPVNLDLYKSLDDIDEDNVSVYTYTDLENNEQTYVVSFPYDLEPSITESVVLDQQITLNNAQSNMSDIINKGENDNTKSGLYVIERKYIDKDGNTLTTIADDSVTRYYYYYVDRSEVIDLNFSTDNRVNHALSVGSYNNLTIGYNSIDEQKQDLSMVDINDLKENSGDNNSIFNTNKSPINLNFTLDKFSTKESISRLFNNKPIDQIGVSDFADHFGDDITINQLIARNEKTFQMDMILSTNTNTVYQSSVDQNNNIDGVSLIDNDVNNILLNKDGIYKLQIKDNGGFAPSVNGEPTEILSSKAYDFNFTLELNNPDGNFTSLYYTNDVPSTKRLSLKSTDPLSNTTTYYSINDDSLIFNFTDSVNPYLALINPANITVTKTNEQGVTSTILQTNSFDRTTAEITVSTIDNNANINDVVSISKLYASGTSSSENLYSYKISIFDKDKPLLSSPEENVTYGVTIQYYGQEENYSSDAHNYFKNTYNITIDNVAPSVNKQNIINNDKLFSSFSENHDDSNYFYSVSNNQDNPTILNFPDTIESESIYVKKVSPSKGYKQTLLPNDPLYDDYINAPASIDRFHVSNTSFKNVKPSGNIISFADNPSYTFEDNCYYEIIETDEAQNYAIYNIYVNDSEQFDSLYISSLSGDVNALPTTNTIDSTETNNISIIASSIDRISFVSDSSTDTFKGDVDQFTKATITPQGNNQPAWTGLYSPYIVEDDDYQISFLNSIVDNLQNMIDNNSNVTKYTITIYNRFHENYVFSLQLPGEELKLNVTNNNGTTFTIKTPDTNNQGVYLTQFKVQKFDSGINTYVDVTTSINGVIETGSADSNTKLETKTYSFTKGSYKFIMTDLAKRQYVQYVYCGKDSDLDYSFDYANKYTTVNDITYTSGNTTLTINENFYSIKVISESSYDLIQDANGRSKFTFKKEGQYEINITWALDLNNATPNVTTLVIDKTLPVVNFTNINGTSLDIQNNTTITEDVLLSWSKSNQFKSSAIITRTYENDTTHTTLSQDQLPYLINQNGVYNIVVTNEIGSQISITFIVTSAEFNFYAVYNNGELIKESNYYTLEADNIKAYYYYIQDTGSDYDLTENALVVTDKTNNITFESMVDESITDLTDTNLNNSIQYKIMRGENILTYIYVFEVVNEINNFANFKINDYAGLFNMTSIDKSLDITFNSYNAGNNTSNTEHYAGNIITAYHYFNGQLQKVINSKNLSYVTNDNQCMFTITDSGIHTIIFKDFAGNIMNDVNITLINNVLFTINDNMPIDNQYFNDTVTLSIQNKINDLIVYNDVNVSILLNNMIMPNIEPDLYGNYTFDLPGYYQLSLMTTVNISSNPTQLLTTYNFNIVKTDIAQLSFSLSSNLGFTVDKLLKNRADITHTLSNKSMLWLSNADSKTGSGIYTVTLSKFNPLSNSNDTFTFSVWVNEESPVIVASNYTFGTSQSETILLNFNALNIYNQIGTSMIKITNSKGKVIYQFNINDQSLDQISNISIDDTETYMLTIENVEGRIISSYKIIKTTPLNASAQIIIFAAAALVITLTIVFISLRKNAKFK